MLKYKFSLRIKNTDYVFSEDFPPGVLLVAEVEFPTATEESKRNPVFGRAMMMQM